MSVCLPRCTWGIEGSNRDGSGHGQLPLRTAWLSGSLSWGKLAPVGHIDSLDCSKLRTFKSSGLRTSNVHSLQSSAGSMSTVQFGGDEVGRRAAATTSTKAQQGKRATPTAIALVRSPGRQRQTEAEVERARHSVASPESLCCAGTSRPAGWGCEKVVELKIRAVASSGQRRSLF